MPIDILDITTGTTETTTVLSTSTVTTEVITTTETDIDIETESQIIIENIEIPETQQFETPPPPARPSVPVESEDDDLADDLTIEETDLDSFDAWDAPPPPPSGPQVKFIPYDDPPRPLFPIKPCLLYTSPSPRDS